MRTSLQTSLRTALALALVLAAAGVLLVSVSTVAPASAAAAKSRAISLRTSATTLTGPARLTLAGAVSRSPRRSIVYLQRYVGAGRWTSIKALRTTTTGGAFSHTLTTASYGRTYYRAYAPPNKKKHLRAAVSPSRPVDVYRRTTATLTTSNTSPVAGDPITLAGAAAPFRAGTPVTLQHLTGGDWRTDGTPTTLNTAGRYAFTRTPATGTSTYRTVVSRTSTYLAATASPALTIAANSTAGTIDGQGIKHISAGWSHTCAVTTGGAAYCWGNNMYGQLGNGTNDSATTPHPVTGLSTGVATITTGHDYTCAVTTSGAAYCWGYNDAGNLGIGSTDTSPDVATTPQPVSGLSTGVATITAGYAHTCALTTSGSGYCWGNNDWGQLGNDTTSDGPTATPQPVSGLSTGVSITAGGDHTCAVTTSGAAYCWGDNLFGQLGTTPAPDFPDGPISTPARRAEARTTPQPVTGLSAGVTTISANYDHTCAVSDGAAKCWGANYHGQLGTGTTDAAGTPQSVTGLSTGITTITAGYDHTCAVTTNGAAKCWGYNEHGQLGSGTTTNAPTPTPQPVTGLTTGVATIRTGTFYTCAVSTNGTAKCWGDNDSGQFGNGTTTNATTPQPIRTSPSGTS